MIDQRFALTRFIHIYRYAQTHSTINITTCVWNKMIKYIMSSYYPYCLICWCLALWCFIGKIVVSPFFQTHQYFTFHGTYDQSFLGLLYVYIKLPHHGNCFWIRLWVNCLMVHNQLSFIQHKSCKYLRHYYITPKCKSLTIALLGVL